MEKLKYTQEKAGRWYFVRRNGQKVVWRQLCGDPARYLEAREQYDRFLGLRPQRRKKAPTMPEHQRRRPCGSADYREAFNRAQVRATRAGIPFTVTMQDVFAMAEMNADRCAVTGIEFCFLEPKIGYRQPYGVSLDRIEPKDGYVPGNVRLVCTAINLFKNDWPEAVMWHVAHEMMSHNGWW